MLTDDSREFVDLMHLLFKRDWIAPALNQPSQLYLM
jgi:hypothetical protein